MPGTNNPSPTPSPFEIVTPGKSKKGGNRGIIVAVVIAVFLVLSVVAGVLLVHQQQNIQEQAATNSCPAAEACPWAGGSGYAPGTLLRSCHPGLNNNTVVDESVCNTAGRVQTCGAATTKYCCPSAGGVWTTDMTVCNSLAATPTPTPTPTPSSTPTSSPTASATPNTCGGSCGSDSNCQSGYICSGGYCRNPLCTLATNCNCGGATGTPTATPVATQTTTQSSPLPIPVTGTDWPTVAGVGVGATAIIISILIAL